MSAFARTSGIVLALAVIALPVVAITQGVGADRFPLKHLRVTGQLQHISDSQLQTTLVPFIRQGFFAVQLEEAQRALEQMDWVDEAKISRKWPDTLEVEIVEHRPFARWDDNQLLSEDGELFTYQPDTTSLPTDLPQLGGNPLRVKEVVASYNQARELLAPSGHLIGEARLDARGSWIFRTRDGLEIQAGTRDAMVRFERFSRLLPYLIPPQNRKLVRADLRYANGFALRWEENNSPSSQPTVQTPVEAPST